MSNNRNSLDAQSANMLRALSSKTGSVFTMEDAFGLLRLSKQGVYDRLSALVKGGWITRLKNGVYYICSFEAGKTGNITEHEFVVASHLVRPYAIGLWSALNQHSLTEQIPDRVYIFSTRRTSKSARTIGSAVYQIVVLPKTHFFGFQEIWFGTSKVLITDLERTILDAFLHPEYCGGMIETVKSFRAAISKINFNKLTTYAKKLEKGVAFKRMGILLESLEPHHEQLTKWQKEISKGITLFDPQGNPSGPIISRWNTQLNFNLEETA